jgi:hypothetical protein
MFFQLLCKCERFRCERGQRQQNVGAAANMTMYLDSWNAPIENNRPNFMFDVRTA